MQINSLKECESQMTGFIGQKALMGAVVDFSTRMNAGPARG
ncbi:MAG: hypothetical protein QFE16_06135 [Pseudomonadota bacterium]|nr:hypothetical protein [Pseudomonadota bacterium]